jgi:regulator of protease activity HflC (stomatin/prohibitin superfamily)
MRATLASITLFALGSLGCATIPAGYRGVKVYYYGDSDGNEMRELGIGRYPYWPITQGVYKFPVFQQNVLWAGDEGTVRFQTREGVNVGVDLGMSYTIDEKRVLVLFQKYRRGIEEITDSFLRHIVVDACSRVAGTMGVEEIYGSKKTEFIDRVNELVAAQVTPNGIKVDRIYIVGQFRLPETVVSAIDTKIAATQRAQQRENELRESEAEAAKRIAQAKGAAEADRIANEARARGIAALSERLSPEFLQYQAIQRWDGQLPTTMAGSSIPFLPPSLGAAVAAPPRTAPNKDEKRASAFAPAGVRSEDASR